MAQITQQSSATLYTVGHSIHPIEVFLALAGQHEITVLIDVRSFPSSRRWPQFNQAELRSSLETAALRYEWLKALGGRRNSSLPDSPHTAWQHPAFHSYADYTDTPEFAAGIEQLEKLAASSRTAIMCSEGLWWRCHRRIVSDHMTVRGWSVVHIMPNGALVRHALPAFARLDHERIIYDGKPE
jgi:uncharacterized protein (DUF488 family)